MWVYFQQTVMGVPVSVIFLFFPFLIWQAHALDSLSDWCHTQVVCFQTKACPATFSLQGVMAPLSQDPPDESWMFWLRQAALHIKQRKVIYDWSVSFLLFVLGAWQVIKSILKLLQLLQDCGCWEAFVSYWSDSFCFMDSFSVKSSWRNTRVC